MQITINLEAGQVGETLGQTLSTLTEDQKQAVALEALKNWLKDPYQTERLAYSQSVIRELREDTFHGSDLKNKTDEEVMKHYRFNERMHKFITTKETMIRSITSEVIAYQKEQIREEIKNDPTMNQVMEATMLNIKENFGKFVHDAMIAWFCQNMHTTIQGVQTALIQTDNNTKFLDNLNTRLR